MKRSRMPSRSSVHQRRRRRAAGRGSPAAMRLLERVVVAAVDGRASSSPRGRTAPRCRPASRSVATALSTTIAVRRRGRAGRRARSPRGSSPRRARRRRAADDARAGPALRAQRRARRRRPAAARARASRCAISTPGISAGRDGGRAASRRPRSRRATSTGRSPWRRARVVGRRPVALGEQEAVAARVVGGGRRRRRARGRRAPSDVERGEGARLVLLVAAECQQTGEIVVAEPSAGESSARSCPEATTLKSLEVKCRT